MKKLKKVILCMLCVGVLCSTTGPTKDNNGDGVIDDLGNAVKDGVDDVEKGVDNVRDGVRDMTDDATDQTPDKTTDKNVNDATK